MGSTLTSARRNENFANCAGLTSQCTQHQAKSERPLWLVWNSICRKCSVVNSCHGRMAVPTGIITAHNFLTPSAVPILLTHSYQNADVKHPPFFRSSGFPFLTVATNMSPEPAAGSLFRRPLMPCTAITYKFFAPAHRRMAISSASTRLMDMCTTANTRSVVAATALMLAPDACSVTFIKNPLGLKSLIISACVEWGAGLCCIADCHSSVDWISECMCTFLGCQHITINYKVIKCIYAKSKSL